MLAFISLLPVVMLLHHVSSHPLSGPEEDTADTAQDRDNQHEQVLKTRVTQVTHSLFNVHINSLIPRTLPGITGSGPSQMKATLEPHGSEGTTNIL